MSVMMFAMLPMPGRSLRVTLGVAEGFQRVVRLLTARWRGRGDGLPHRGLLDGG